MLTLQSNLYYKNNKTSVHHKNMRTFHNDRITTERDRKNRVQREQNSERAKAKDKSSLANLMFYSFAPAFAPAFALSASALSEL